MYNKVIGVLNSTECVEIINVSGSSGKLKYFC